MTNVDSGIEQKTIEAAVREAGGTPKDALNEINSRIEAVLDESPSDATVEFKMRKSKKGYRGLLKVCSQQGKFVGGGRGLRFGDVVERIFDEVHDQLSEWRRARSDQLATEL